MYRQRWPRSDPAFAQLSVPLLSAARIMDTIECVDREQRPEWDRGHVQGDVNLHILHLREGIFSLDSAIALDKALFSIKKYLYF